MTSTNLGSAQHPILAWTSHVPAVEPAALQQLRNIASLPFIHKHVACMPDVHLGIGATVGSVIATKHAIVPAAVGVDIGCGMIATKTNLRAIDLPDNLFAIRSAIEAAVPHGRSNNGGAGDKGGWSGTSLPAYVATNWAEKLAFRYKLLTKTHQALNGCNSVTHLGTLGGGNHFIELCLDQTDTVWIMLHSGSRGVGNRIGSHFIRLAKEEMLKKNVSLPDKDLAYLEADSPLFSDYCMSVSWAQDFAAMNRKCMLNAVLKALASELAREVTSVGSVTSCHHNYISKEIHFGEDVWVTRKGAVRADIGDIVIIPGSMGQKSYIGFGKGNPDSFRSCSHGAGRVMSRGEAKRTFTLEDHAKATEGVECRKDADVIDETRDAYKKIDDVMASQEDLVGVLFTLNAILCVKG